MEEANTNNKQRKLVKRKLPRGTSEYQVCNSTELILKHVNLIIFTKFTNYPHAIARLLGLLMIQMMKITTLIMTTKLVLEWSLMSKVMQIKEVMVRI